MTAKDYLRISLLFPYVGWFILGFLLGLNLPEPLKQILIMFSIGWVIWFIPYTVLAIVLRVWSNNKEEKQIIRNFAFAPIYLALIFSTISLLPSAIGNIFNGNLNNGLISNITISSSALRGFSVLPVYSISFGYFFVLIAYIIYKYLKHNNKFRDEQIDNSGESTQ